MSKLPSENSLRTLKDMKCDCCEQNAKGIHGEDTKLIEVINLKQEAIKQRDYKFKMALNAPDRGTKEFLLGQCAFIEEFFNLEDLNESDSKDGTEDKILPKTKFIGNIGDIK